ncbi:MAG TPA: bifunctional photosynthetic reaction center subunit L/M [Roseiflexaceae bacterium]|nr:bifunctional photosynthetic reaction center subunit L/M [Roseiflexaceae bacterium]
MSDVSREFVLLPDGDTHPAPVAGAVAEGVQAEVVPFAVIEEFYKRPGGTLTARILGFEPFDVWFGRFYVGLSGVVASIGIFFGVVFYLYQAFVVERSFNLLAARLDPPPISVGLGLAPSAEQGLFWQLTMFAATIAFVGWLWRQIDISMKLRIGLEVPIAFGAVVSSWITLQWLRPIAMGAWGNGFPLGITHHLDWVSNIGYQYYNFFYNPFHAIGISLLFASTLFLAMHGSAVLSEARRSITDDNIHVFWRNIVGYSIGEIGIHRVAFWTGAASVLFANVCIFLSGTYVRDWNAFWGFWDRMPFWSGFGAGFVLIGIGLVFSRRNRPSDVDLEAARNARGLEGNIGKPIYVGLMDRLFGSGQVLPLYLGYWGAASMVFFGVTCFIILTEYLYLVGYNPIVFAREFFNLAVMPPVSSYGLRWDVPWHEGGAWLVATFFLHLTVLTWWARLYSRARRTGVGSQLAWGVTAALSLYFVIYLIRPMLIGNWSEAAGHGFRAILDWTNYVSIQTGNFYYNPFHMISIFFLLGSTLLLAMHGATIVATSSWKSEMEFHEMMAEGSGTHRAQLLWRWIMGFNANSYNIHLWAWWFAALCGFTGAIGLLLSGTLVNDWYAWGESIRIVAPWENPDWTQFVFR